LSVHYFIVGRLKKLLLANWGLVGSSSGSVNSVSFNIVPLAIRTETDTSVIRPASICGVVGIKPTVGLTSRSGVIPVSENFDTVRDFGRTVRDAALALDVIVGRNERDAATLVKPQSIGTDHASCIRGKEVLKGARFDLPMTGCCEEVHEDVKIVGEMVMAALRQAGAEIIEIDFPCAEERVPPGSY
jgi:amidase